MNSFDWIIVFIFLGSMIAMATWLGRHQRTKKDYYLGGYRMNHWAIAVSTMATQCSTNSLLGAPAFVIAVGGLLWLQYELAVPLAMIGVMRFLLPFFRRQQVVSVYEYLEKRYGPESRTVLSVLFQFLRAFSTGVTVYGISIVIQQLLGIPFWVAVLILGLITVIYDFLGGMQAVVYSDVIQMIVLYLGIAVCLGYAVRMAGGWTGVWSTFPAEKLRTLDFSGWGFHSGETFTFWPMLIGGFFLYLSYYGCDQTQVQRELSARNLDETNMSLFINGVARFPLVITYCLVGVAIGAFIVQNPEFLHHITDPATGQPNYNLVVPSFCLHYLPHGIIGLVIVSLFAAAMSSLDSTINSLSATTIHDIIERFFVRGGLHGASGLIWARLTTIFWGGVCVTFSFFVGDISESIIESINKISSVVNGPILATFLLATLTRRTNDRGVVIGIIAGFLANVWLWIYCPGISWLWWNVIGCVITFALGYAASQAFPLPGPAKLDAALIFQPNAMKQFGYQRRWGRYQLGLVFYFIFMLLILKGIDMLAR